MKKVFLSALILILLGLLGLWFSNNIGTYCSFPPYENGVQFYRSIQMSFLEVDQTIILSYLLLSLSFFSIGIGSILLTAFLWSSKKDKEALVLNGIVIILTMFFFASNLTFLRSLLIAQTLTDFEPLVQYKSLLVVSFNLVLSLSLTNTVYKLKTKNIFLRSAYIAFILVFLGFLFGFFAGDILASLLLMAILGLIFWILGIFKTKKKLRIEKSRKFYLGMALLVLLALVIGFSQEQCIEKLTPKDFKQGTENASIEGIWYSPSNYTLIAQPNDTLLYLAENDAYCSLSHQVEELSFDEFVHKISEISLIKSYEEAWNEEIIVNISLPYTVKYTGKLPTSYKESFCPLTGYRIEKIDVRERYSMYTPKEELEYYQKVIKPSYLENPCLYYENILLETDPEKITQNCKKLSYYIQDRFDDEWNAWEMQECFYEAQARISRTNMTEAIKQCNQTEVIADTPLSSSYLCEEQIITDYSSLVTEETHLEELLSTCQQMRARKYYCYIALAEKMNGFGRYEDKLAICKEFATHFDQKWESSNYDELLNDCLSE